MIFLVYEDTMQSQALTLIATKLEASLAVEGELSADGLSVLADTSDSLVLELARALVTQVGATESAEAVWPGSGSGMSSRCSPSRRPGRRRP